MDINFLGSILLPQNYLILAKDITVFATTYGTNINVFDQFDGSLDNTILKPTDPKRSDS